MCDGSLEFFHISLLKESHRFTSALLNAECGYYDPSSAHVERLIRIYRAVAVATIAGTRGKKDNL